MITKERNKPTSKNELINQLVRLSGDLNGCKFPRQLTRIVRTVKMAPGKPAPWLKTDPA
jgi:hypothetical protein